MVQGVSGGQPVQLQISGIAHPIELVEQAD
jgi:hypothetical protein